MIIVGNGNQSTEFATNPSTNTDMNNMKNNSLPVQTVAPPSGIGIDSATNSTARHESSSSLSSSSFQRRRRPGGRSAPRGRAPARQPLQQEPRIPQVDCVSQDSTTPDQTDMVADVAGANSRNPSATTNTSRAHQRGNTRSAGSSGKYRQRQQTSQLIDGMESLTGLDIDLAESIVPTSTSRDLGDSNRRRHATNSRKVNLTHLLNYNYDGRPRGGRGNSRYNSGQSVQNQRNSSSQYRDSGTTHKFNKQQFLQANCQFVVADGHDYTIHKVDPDWPVDWNCIEEVRFMQSASSETTCPICLEPPIAAKITRCGHIYCWTCMLHYLSLSDEKRRQCPICFEPVYKSDLRSVISHSFTNYSVDEQITMRLMIRRKGCVEAEPYVRCENPQASPSTHHSLPQEGLDSPQHWSWANLVIVDPRTVVSKIARRERTELEFKLNTDRDQPEVCFVEQALGILDERVDRLLNSIPEVGKTKAKENESSVTNRNIESSAQAPGSDPFKSYLFYQCTDGQHIYLNPFSTKVLCHEYGSLENCPIELQAKILQMDWISMNEAWRKRFRYLSHLPLTCEFRLIEIDFEKSNLVSNSTYKTFEDQIKWREEEREKRRREERKRDKKIQVQQDRKIYGIQPSLKINLDNIDQFPSVSDERYLGLTQPRNRSRIDHEDYYSSDEEGDIIEAIAQSSAANNDEQQISTEAINDEIPEEAISSVATSFRDIQLQEAALEAKQKNNRPPPSQSVWGAKKSGSSSANQSSFAQLLVDAKKSQKQLTRSATSSQAAQPGPTSANQAAGFSHHQRQRLTSGSDDEGEELRAPRVEYTISDFIDMNLVSSKKKGKKKS